MTRKTAWVRVAEMFADEAMRASESVGSKRAA